MLRVKMAESRGAGASCMETQMVYNGGTRCSIVEVLKEVGVCVARNVEEPEAWSRAVNNNSGSC